MSSNKEYHFYRYHGRTPEQKAAYLKKLSLRRVEKRAAWTPEQHEAFRQMRKDYYRRVWRYKKIKSRCVICGLRLASTFNASRSLKYCEDCRADKSIMRYTSTWLTRRCAWAKKGWPLEPLMGTERRKRVYALWEAEVAFCKAFGQPIPPPPTAQVRKGQKKLILYNEDEENVI